MIGRAALLANKRASGRAKDAADVEALEAFVEPDLTRPRLNGMSGGSICCKVGRGLETGEAVCFYCSRVELTDPPSSQILVSWPAPPGFGESPPLRDVAFGQGDEVLVLREAGDTAALERTLVTPSDSATGP